MIHSNQIWIYNKAKVDILVCLNNQSNDFFELNNLSKILFLVGKLGETNAFVHAYLNHWIAGNAAGFEKYVIELQNDIFNNLQNKKLNQKQILKQITDFKIEFKQYKVFEIVEFLTDLKKDILELNGVK